MEGDGAYGQARGREAAARAGAGDPGWNTSVLTVILGLVFLITAKGFRTGSVGWAMVAVAQFLVVGGWAGAMGSTPAWERGTYLNIFGWDFYRVISRMMIEFYLALLLALPFTTVFDG